MGRYLSRRFQESGTNVILVSRQKNHIGWDEPQRLVQALEHSDMLINLAGKSVNCRYNERNKSAILLSRTRTTKALGDALLQCTHPPALWINSSTATIYRHAEDRPMTEMGGEIGTGFSVGVATQWEESFFAFSLPHTRQVALRTAIVLGGSGGALKPYQNLVRFRLGGRQGGGNQMFSWIHIEDVFRTIVFLSTHSSLSGILNCASPNPLPNRLFMQMLRQSMGVSIGMPAPTWLLKIGTRIIGTETELLLKSRWVVPERLQQNGFEFKFGQLSDALQDLCQP